MYKVLLTGGNGFLGKSILNSNIFKKYIILAPNSQDLNLTNKKHVDIFFQKNQVNYIINCAARGGRRTNNFILSPLPLYYYQRKQRLQ